MDGALGTVVCEHAIAQLIPSQDRLPAAQIIENDFSEFAQIQSDNFYFGQKNIGRESSACTSKLSGGYQRKGSPSLKLAALDEGQLRSRIDQCV